MSKWIDNYNESNKVRLNKRIAKLKEEYEYYRRECIDYPYDRYEKAKQKRLEEIDELELLANPSNVKREIEDWKEEVKRLRELLGKVHLLGLNIDPCDQKSHANLQRLLSMTGKYNSFDEQFKAQAESGVW